MSGSRCMKSWMVMSSHLTLLHPLQLPCDFLQDKAADEPEPRILLKDKTDETALDELQCSGHWVSPLSDFRKWSAFLAFLELGFALLAHLNAAQQVIVGLVLPSDPRRTKIRTAPNRASHASAIIGRSSVGIASASMFRNLWIAVVWICEGKKEGRAKMKFDKSSL